MEAMGDKLRSEEGRHIQEARVHGGAGFRATGVGWQEAIDGLAGLGEGARGVFSNVFGTQCEEDCQESPPGHDHFTLGYSKLIEEAILGYKEDKLQLVGVVV